jgi:AraC-like DNA-binding protein
MGKVMNESIYVSELGTSKHTFNKYHFCRGNSNTRKSRLGLILNGCGTYIYLNQKLKVNKGDLVFIPENVYCYSEWHGEPLIEVVYLSCFMHYGNYTYGAQIIDIEESVKTDILQISELLGGGMLERLEAYSRFYKLLQAVIVKMKPLDIVIDTTLQSAIEYVTQNWDKDFSVADIAKKCCVSESTVYHLFRKNLGQTPISFVNSIRINVAIEHLENSNYSISRIGEMVGFHSENHFRRIFSDLTGMTPLKFRKNK